MTFGLVVSALGRQENTAALTISATVITNMALCGMIGPFKPFRTISDGLVIFSPQHFKLKRLEVYSTEAGVLIIKMFG
jgi:hypothetical protein